MNQLFAESRLANDFGHLFVFLAPFLAIAICIHLFEQLVQRRMARRYGWRSILFTGWLGTPIHEFSHAVMCYTFRHRIDEMALFKPDMESGRLGYVRHSFQKGNWIQEVGNLFIGIAPLIAGTLVLTGLLFLFYREDAMQLLTSSGESAAATNWWAGMAEPIKDTFLNILTWENFKTFRFWVFIYLVLCVASHMAPSRSDYVGAGRPILFVSLIGGLVFVALSLAGWAEPTTQFLSQMTRPIIAMFSLSIGLCAVVGVLVFAITALTDVFWIKSRKHRIPVKKKKEKVKTESES